MGVIFLLVGIFNPVDKLELIIKEMDLAKIAEDQDHQNPNASSMDRPTESIKQILSRKPVFLELSGCLN
jgi:hypothetical protein